ncbi:fatty acid hydroxylase [Rhodothalassium salexigens]|uniref:sterol desaturase family protein n=1 Tax=Rhodothalassium salexigens TaxID=1086 RepID=UPI001913ACD9|nr:sterol desaturase family protein [Rhodothalassium salexigens]MBK5919835.1 fatty acid hydroxylase [Rhodothalassium salexigens]
MFGTSDFWTKQTHHLDKMTMGQLVRAYFRYYAIQAYLAIAAVCILIASFTVTAVVPNLLAIGSTLILFPLVWYILHRWVLHGTWLAKSPLTAATWKRVHYDHHMDPHNLQVLFGALHTTLPPIALITMPIGYGLDGIGGLCVAFATGCLMAAANEFVHCIQHLSIKPGNDALKTMKLRHMAHHFHDEDGNYGITDFTWDRIFGTLYDRKDRPEKSPYVFNLGYDAAMAARYPWVAELSGGVDERHPKHRRPPKGYDELAADADAPAGQD